MQETEHFFLFHKCDLCHKKDKITKFITPCQCNKLVHSKCLDKLRLFSDNENSLTICEKCNTIYTLEETEMAKSLLYLQYFKFTLIILCQIIITCIIWQTIQILISLILWSLNCINHNYFILKWFPHNFPEYLAYYIISIPVFFFLAGLLTLLYSCCNGCMGKSSMNHVYTYNDDWLIFTLGCWILSNQCNNNLLCNNDSSSCDLSGFYCRGGSNSTADSIFIIILGIILLILIIVVCIVGALVSIFVFIYVFGISIYKQIKFINKYLFVKTHQVKDTSNV